MSNTTQIPDRIVHFLLLYERNTAIVLQNHKASKVTNFFHTDFDTDSMQLVLIQKFRYVGTGPLIWGCYDFTVRYGHLIFL